MSQQPQKHSKVPHCPFIFPHGQILRYNETDSTDYEPEDNIDRRNFYRHAAQLHKEVRQYIRKILVPGTKASEISTKAEEYLHEITKCIPYHSYNADFKPQQIEDSRVPEQVINFMQHHDEEHALDPSKESQYLPGGIAYYCGQAFPLGISVNNVAAHQAPLPEEDYVFQKNDMVKIDFGLHCNGYLIDSAFTIHWNPELDVIAEASKEATNTGIKAAGVDVQFNEIGKQIEEVITSYEYKGKQLQPVRNLSGHGVDRFQVHCGSNIPLYNDHNKERMQDGQTYACETFASTGKGYISDEYPVSHYMLEKSLIGIGKKAFKGSKQEYELFNFLRSSFNTMAWNPNWISRGGYQHLFNRDLQRLCTLGYAVPYPKLSEKKGVYISQFEHTFMVSEWGKEVFSRGDDY